MIDSAKCDTLKNILHLESIPTGAKVFFSDKRVYMGVTPLKIEAHRKVKVIVYKEGYHEWSAIVNINDDTPVFVRLFKQEEHAGDKKAK